MTETNSQNIQVDLLISFRGKKIEIPLLPTTTQLDIKSHLSKQAMMNDNIEISPNHIKLIHKGKVIVDLYEHEPSEMNLFTFLTKDLKNKASSKTIIRIMATGSSLNEARQVEISKQNAPRIRDDLTNEGLREIEERQRLGKQMLLSATHKGNNNLNKKYGFGRIETLPMLPDQHKAKEILQSLANDPGVLACMAKHKWNVGCLAELFPEGEVGVSDVCVMGLNQNNGQKILLRLRTDDLSGFRKILSIKKVLYHELAHNVHSEHDGEFYKLMRQIEQECNEMDWTQGSGLTDMGVDGNMSSYQGGTYRLGGETEILSTQNMSARDLAARAALMRMSKEEEEIQEACGCGKIVHNKGSNLQVTNESKTTYNQLKGDGDNNESLL